MEPEEVVDQLEQAVQSAQANMVAFRNALESTSGKLTALKDSYSGKAKELKDTLAELAPDNEALADEIATKVIEGTLAAQADIESDIQAYDDRLESLINVDIGVLTSAFAEEQSVALAFIDESSARIKEINTEYESVGDNYKSSLDSALSTLAASEEAVRNRLSEFSEMISDNLQKGHLEVLDEFNEMSSTAMNSELVAFFDETNGEFEDANEKVLGALGDMGEAAAERFDELTTEIIDYAGDEATQEMKDIANGLIDSIVEELAATISESIVKSQVGVSVTAATSPYLPILIAFNKIFDALEGAIKLWKEFMDTFG